MSSKVSKQDREVPHPGDYYRCKKLPRADSDVVVGDLVIITAYDDEDAKVSYARLEHAYSWDIDIFLRHYKFAPEGKIEREHDLQVLLSTFAELRAEEKTLTDAFQNLDRPLISAHSEEVSSAIEEVAGSDEVAEHQNQALLVQTPDAIQARRVKKGVALMRNEALKFEKRMRSVQGQISNFKKEQQAYLEAVIRQTSGLQKMVKIAEELIWTVNIYLGRGEEIIQIREGIPATAEERISVRQLVLYADEEMAVRPLKGGLDFQELDQLDGWLLEGKNLQQVLPDTRGIIAFKPRRSGKDYTGGDNSAAAQMYNAEMNKKNAQTYFLMRNGENLYRVRTDIQVGPLLVPTSTEFDELFETSDYDYSTGGHETRKVKPGTKAFTKAMEAADEHQRHYGRILLFMQGIIDRTKIFAPLMNESARVNLLDRKNHESYIRYIYDGQNLLPTGRLPFWQWVKDVTKHIDVGHRVIGIFNDYNYGIKWDKELKGYDRITPKNAERPKNMQLYTIEGRRSGGFFIRYKREDEVQRRRTRRHRFFDPDESNEAKVRASCLLYPTDQFFLDFDAINVDDMKFYLTSRVDRHAYITMFPLVETTLALKEEEQKEEAPFRQLLIGEIVKDHGVDFEEAESSIDDLIIWWKFKNPTHRALSKDNKKALRMIVQEFGLRLAKSHQLNTSLDRIKAAAELLRDNYAKSTQELLYIGYRGTGLLSVLVAENNENIFVDEQIWRVSGSLRFPEIMESRRWRVVDSRRMSWTELYTSERWKSWRFGLRRDQYLTDPEIAILLDGIWNLLEHKVTENRRHYESQTGEGEKVMWPIAIDMTRDKEIRCWYYDKDLKPNLKKIFLSDREYLASPKVANIELSWSHEHGQIKRSRYLGSIRHHDSVSGSRWDKAEGPPRKPWENSVAQIWNPQVNTSVIPEEKLQLGQMQPRLLWVNSDNIRRYEEQFERYCIHHKQLRDWRDLLFVTSQASNAMKFRWESIQYQKYLNEHGDPELWPDELQVREKKAPNFQPESFEKACRQLIVVNVDLVGLTVDQIIGKTLVKLTDVEAQYLPLELVIQPEEDDHVEDASEDGAEEPDDVEEEVWEKPVN